MERGKHRCGALDFVLRERERGSGDARGEDGIFWSRGCRRMRSTKTGVREGKVGVCVGMSVSRKGCWWIILEGCRFRARNHCLGWRELGKQVA